MDTIKFTFGPTENKATLYYNCEINSLINKIKEVIEKVSLPFIFNTGTLDNHFLDVYYADFYSLNHAIHDMLSNITGTNNIYDITEIACVKDEEWTKERNKNLKYEVFIKYRMKSKYAEIIIAACNKWLQELESLYAKVIAAEEADKKAKEERQAQFNLIKVYEHINPKGGEDGEDGYFDADISDGQQVIRFVVRNVFDFGFYTYPKHFEGTEDIFNSEKWTELEHKVSNWLTEFSPFTTNVRM